jgi:hypothetical protein
LDDKRKQCFSSEAQHADGIPDITDAMATTDFDVLQKVAELNGATGEELLHELGTCIA